MNGLLEAVVGLLPRGPAGGELEIKAVIDTGHSGQLALPPEMVSELELPHQIKGSSATADGTKVDYSIHTDAVVWDGQPRRVGVDTLGLSPLLGMSLLNTFAAGPWSAPLPAERRHAFHVVGLREHVEGLDADDAVVAR